MSSEEVISNARLNLRSQTKSWQNIDTSCLFNVASFMKMFAKDCFLFDLYIYGLKIEESKQSDKWKSLNSKFKLQPNNFMVLCTHLD